jgi:carbon starvation protein
MADIFSKLPGMKTLMSYWYHFVIMFEALFILTLLETGTRVARFVFQETAASFTPKAAIGGKARWGMNIFMSMLTCFCWGYLLYTGNINTLWRMLGIANQLLATIALAIGTTYLLLHAPKRVHALCTGIPFVFVIITVLTAGCQSIAGWWNVEIPRLLAQLNQPYLAAPAAEALHQQVFNLRLTATLTSVMLVLTVIITLDAVRRWFGILARPSQTPTT